MSGLADETICTGGSLADTTGGGLSRASVNTVTSTAMTPTTPSAMTPARPGSARTPATQLDAPSDLAVGQPSRQQGVRLAVVIVVLVGLTFCAQSAMKALGGQFGSHASES